MSCFVFSASAADYTYTEYYSYSGVGISDSLCTKLTGFALNYCREYGYSHWCAVRVDQYKYLLCFVYSSSDIDFLLLHSRSLDLYNALFFIYDEHCFSYQNNNTTVYQAGFSSVREGASVRVSLNRSYIIGNIPGSFGNGSVTSEINSNNFVYLRFLLYVVIIFMLLYVAFQFIKKRWLIQ